MKRHYESIINQSTRVSRCSSISRSKIHIHTLCSKLDHKILRSRFKMRLTPKPRFKRNILLINHIFGASTNGSRYSKIITLFLDFHKIDFALFRLLLPLITSLKHTCCSLFEKYDYQNKSSTLHTKLNHL